MKTLLKIVVGAAIAGALLNLLMKQRRRAPRADLVADTNTVHTGDVAEEQRAPQPQDWRGAQNVLDS
jgi:hypothetical protein